jgi:FKBP-type peptidyl-prolyl cis-trans isomerase
MKKKVLKKEKENKGKVYNFIKNAKGLLMDGDFYRRVFLLMAVLVLLGGTVSASWIAIRNSNKSVADAKKQQEILKQIEEQQASQATAQEESKAKQDALPKAENALILTDRVTELKIEDLVTGSGDEVKEGETIKVKYQGTLADGRIFDGNLDKDPIEFALSGLNIK